MLVDCHVTRTALESNHTIDREIAVLIPRHHWRVVLVAKLQDEA